MVYRDIVYDPRSVLAYCCYQLPNLGPSMRRLFRNRIISLIQKEVFSNCASFVDLSGKNGSIMYYTISSILIAEGEVELLHLYLRKMAQSNINMNLSDALTWMTTTDPEKQKQIIELVCKHHSYSLCPIRFGKHQCAEIKYESDCQKMSSSGKWKKTWELAHNKFSQQIPIPRNCMFLAEITMNWSCEEKAYVEKNQVVGTFAYKPIITSKTIFGAHIVDDRYLVFTKLYDSDVSGSVSVKFHWSPLNHTTYGATYWCEPRLFPVLCHKLRQHFPLGVDGETLTLWIDKTASLKLTLTFNNFDVHFYDPSQSHNLLGNNSISLGASPSENEQQCMWMNNSQRTIFKLEHPDRQLADVVSYIPISWDKWITRLETHMFEKKSI